MGESKEKVRKEFGNGVVEHLGTLSKGRGDDTYWKGITDRLAKGVPLADIIKKEEQE